MMKGEPVVTQGKEKTSEKKNYRSPGNDKWTHRGKSCH